jgi:flagellar capping protein FliD
LQKDSCIARGDSVTRSLGQKMRRVLYCSVSGGDVL